MPTLNQARTINDLKKKIHFLQSNLFDLKRKFQESINEIEEIEKRKDTDYYAFIGFEGGKPVSMGIYHKDEDSEKIGDEILQQVQVIIPIPDPEHLKEFDGF